MNTQRMPAYAPYRVARAQSGLNDSQQIQQGGDCLFFPTLCNDVFEYREMQYQQATSPDLFKAVGLALANFRQKRLAMQ